MDDRVYFRQLLSGHDFATDDPLARQMVNLVYLVGDRATGECVVVDPAYGVNDLLDIVEGDGMRLTGVLASHYHPDHIGGSMMNYRIEGVAALLERADVPIHVNENELPWVTRTTGVASEHFHSHASGDVVTVGELEITLMHTPGHTPGSQCFHVGGCLLSGDTLFLDGCGRTDLPGSNPDDMFDSLRALNALPDDTVLFPGHRYSDAPYEDMGRVKQHNFVLKPSTKEQWMMIFGGG
ncbi:MAG: MBL fold metallo-hydrolase [Actinomycetota bacterium]